MISTLHAIPDTDWQSLSNRQLATQLRLKPNYVGVYRRLYKKPKGPRSPGSGRPSRLDVSEIDWKVAKSGKPAFSARSHSTKRRKDTPSKRTTSG